MTTDEISGKPRVPKEELRKKIETWRHRADVVEKHGLEHERDIINKRNEWNVGTWRSMANELEALIERYDYE